MGNTVFFTADDGEHGSELWKTDGTEAGTVLVKDINTGTQPTYDSNGNPVTDASGDPVTRPAGAGIFALAVLQGQVFFAANDGARTDLWKSDGTDAGTTTIAGVYGCGSPVALDGVLYFSAAQEATGAQGLWASDGTETGTRLLASGLSLQGEPVRFQNKLVFAANDGTQNGLWVSDGGQEPTQLMSFPSGVVSVLTPAGTEAFFSADDGVAGTELWKTDGTAEGTVLVKDIATGTRTLNGYDYPNASFPSGLTAVEGLLVFAASDGKTGVELWKSDGTAAGTLLVKDVVPGTQTVNSGGTRETVPKSSYPYNFTAFKGSTYFTTADGGLWKTDGTTRGTTLVKAVDKSAANPNSDSSGSFGSLAVLNGALLFAANDGVHGTELWKSDGTAAGTQRLNDAPPAAPTVASVDLPAAGTYLPGQKLSFTVHFSDAVAVAGKPSLAISIGGKTKQATYTSGGGTPDVTFSYTVAKGDLDLDGVVVGKLSGTIRSAASAKVKAALALPALDASGIRVDGVVPEVKTVTVAPGTYAAASAITIQVTFSEAVKVTGTPQIAVTIGKTVRQATYVSGDGTATLAFQVVVQAGDAAPKGIVLAKTIVLPAGAGLTDLPGNAAKLGLKSAKTSAVKVVA